MSNYLQGRCEQEHVSTGARLRMNALVTPTQLAVLAQNKAYELTASEIEQRVMTRGGPKSNERDDPGGLQTMAQMAVLRGQDHDQAPGAQVGLSYCGWAHIS